MFSEALYIMDRNMERLMVDELREEVLAKEQELESKTKELALQRNELAAQKKENELLRSQLAAVQSK